MLQKWYIVAEIILDFQNRNFLSDGKTLIITQTLHNNALADFAWLSLYLTKTPLDLLLSFSGFFLFYIKKETKLSITQQTEHFSNNLKIYYVLLKWRYRNDKTK